MKFERRLSCTTSEPPVKFHSDTTVLTPILVASRLCEISHNKTAYRLVNRDAESCNDSNPAREDINYLLICNLRQTYVFTSCRIELTKWCPCGSDLLSSNLDQRVQTPDI